MAEQPRSGPSRTGDEVGRRLVAFARVLLDDRVLAEEIVGAVLAETGEQAGQLESVRFRQLAHLVYVRCNRSRLGPIRSAHDPADPRCTAPLDAGLQGLSDQQRDVIALNLFGAHSRAQSAKEMCLPEDVVAALLRSGLRSLRSARTGGC